MPTLPWISASVGALIALLLSTLGAFLSVWIVVPAFTFAVLPLAVGAPEMSPWLLVGNAIATGWALTLKPAWLSRAALGFGLVGLLLSSLPLMQMPNTVHRATLNLEGALRSNGHGSLPPTVLAQMRSRPFNLADVFRGIPLPAVRHDGAIPFASPDGVPLTLEVYRPPQRGKHPTLLVLYGGAWQNGKPTDNAAFNRYLAAQGYTVIALDYRHAPRYQFPTQIRDVQTALTWIRDRADEYEVDLDRLAVMGRSAGAQLAMLLAYTTMPSPVRAVVNYYGPVDLAEGYRHPPIPDPIDTRAVLENFLGYTPDQAPDLYQHASPIHAIRSDLPPTLSIYGQRDRVVEPKFGRLLHNQLQVRDNLSILIELPWADHAFDAVFNGVSNQLALFYTERFLASILKPHA